VKLNAFGAGLSAIGEISVKKSFKADTKKIEKKGLPDTWV
jgi:hypothetical protein